MIDWLLSHLPPRIPKGFSVKDAHYFLDGGTTVIQGVDERGRQRLITLTQQMLPRESWLSPPIGRLYVDGRPVPLRSTAEASVLSLLEAAVTELRGRASELPQASANEEETDSGRAIFFGSSDLAELAQIQGEQERTAWMVNRVIDYVRSEESGKLRGSAE